MFPDYLLLSKPGMKQESTFYVGFE